MACLYTCFLCITHILLEQANRDSPTPRYCALSQVENYDLHDGTVWWIIPPRFSINQCECLPTRTVLKRVNPG